MALLRVLPEERLPSIDRFAVELQDALKRGSYCDPRELMFHPPHGSRLPRVRRMVRRFISYPRALSSVAADVYHVIDQSYSHLVRFLPGDRSVVTCHDLTPLRVAADGLPVPQTRLAFQRYRFAVRALPRAAWVACVSHTTRGDVLRFLDVDPARVVVINPGLHPRFRSLGDETTQHVRSHLGASRHIILHVDSGLPYKNVDGTLRVLANLRKRGLDATLVRVGRQMNRVNAELADSLAISGSVVELGRVSDDRLVELYNAADLLLFPSHHEGFGWPPLEAMSCGTPVVASNCPPLEETIAGAALSAPAQDVASLSEASARVLTDESLANRVSAAGRRRAAQFDWADCAAKYADLYRVVAGV